MSNEYYEILEYIKELILSEEFNEHINNENIYSKEFIKKFILTNNYVRNKIKEVRDIKKKSLIINKNFFSIIRNYELACYKELNMIQNVLSKFSLFYNEPSYIKNLNTQIFNKILSGLIETSNQLKNECIMNGYILLI